MTRLCIVTGGTGGHIFPALALADHYRQTRDDAEIVFVGNDDRMEAKLIPERGYPFHALHTKGLGPSFFSKIQTLWLFLKAKQQAKKFLIQQSFDVVIGFGGYVSAPVLLAAQQLGIPTIIHEQNSMMGKANRLAKKRASAFVTSYPDMPGLWLGNPRASLVSTAKADTAYAKKLGLDLSKPIYLVMMGSLGSSSVDEILAECLEDLPAQLVYASPQESQVKNSDHVHVVDFIQTEKIYGLLSGIICRAGATTLAEITALGLPAILIPSPYVANNHQYYNAKALVDAGAAVMIEESELNAQRLKEVFHQVFLDETLRHSLSEQSKKFGKPEAAMDLAQLIDDVIEGRR